MDVWRSFRPKVWRKSSPPCATATRRGSIAVATGRGTHDARREQEQKEAVGQDWKQQKAFADAATQAEARHGEVEWVHFGAAGWIVPRAPKASKDIVVYDNVTAVVETEGKRPTRDPALVRSPATLADLRSAENLVGDQTAAATVLFLPGFVLNRPDVEAPAGQQRSANAETDRRFGKTRQTARLHT
jgi:hypothetical protein